VADTRPRVPLNGKAINLAQLSKEVGAALSASDTEVVVADANSTITASALSKALAAHTLPPPPEPPFTDDERRRMRALIAR
jgi:hypothetical protein